MINNYRITRDDVEVVLKQVEADNKLTENELARVKLNYEQQMIKLLMDRGSRAMTAHLIKRIEELEAGAAEDKQDYLQDRERLIRENIVLKAKLSAIGYELMHHSKLKGDRILQILQTESKLGFWELLEMLTSVRAIVNCYNAKKTPSRRLYRLLAILLDDFEKKYPDFGKSQFYEELLFDKTGTCDQQQ